MIMLTKKSRKYAVRYRMFVENNGYGRGQRAVRYAMWYVLSLTGQLTGFGYVFLPILSPYGTVQKEFINKINK